MTSGKRSRIAHKQQKLERMIKDAQLKQAMSAMYRRKPIVVAIRQAINDINMGEARDG